MTDEQKLKLKQLLETTDLPLTEIAKQMGMSFGTLRLRIAESRLKVSRTLTEATQ